jgi:glycosyltransferase involved in cell wall biosynthesis
MENQNINIAVIIPCYKVAKHIEQVILSIPDFISHIIVVDDKCPQNSGLIAQNIQKKDNRNIHVLFHEKNKGVGGAVISGYQKAINLECDIAIKIDGDGQMDVKYIKSLIEPIIDKKSDYTKGNRFTDFQKLKQMPKIRLFGNSVLSFIVKLCSGYWNIMDPTNGFTAINLSALNKIKLNTISNRYFFETDMLINLNINNCVVQDIAMPSKYADEESSLSIGKILFQFPFKLLKGFVKRIFFKYYIYDFNMASIYIVFGLPMTLWGIFFGAYKWYIGYVTNTIASTGTVMLSVLPLILGMQFLLQAIHIDIYSSTKK